MKKILSFLVFSVLLLQGVKSFGQAATETLKEKEFFSISEEGEEPPQYCYTVMPGCGPGGQGMVECTQYVDNNGYQIDDGGGPNDNEMCFGQADANCSQFMAPGPGAIWEVRIRDGDGATLGDVNLMDTATIPATDYGLNVLSGTYGFDGTNPRAIGTNVMDGSVMLNTDYGLNTRSGVYGYDGTNFQPVSANTDLSDDVASTINPLAVQGFTYGYDRAADNWDRIDSIVHPAVMATAQYGLVTYNGNYFWNLSDAEFARWDGNYLDQEVVSTDTSAPYAMSFNYGYDPDNSEWKWMHVLATLPATMATTMNPLVTAGATYGYDLTAAEFVRIISEDGAVDNTTATDDGLLVNNRAFYYDLTGTNWDRQQGEDGYSYVQDKAYTSATNSNRVQEINPLSEHYEFAELVDVTDGADATFYYYTDMTGKRASAYQLSLDCDAGTVTATIECTLEDDCAPAACTYIDVTTSITTGPLVATAAPASALWVDNDHKLGSCKYTRVVIVANTAGGATGDWKTSTEKHH